MTREDIQTPFSCLPYRLEKLGNRLFLAVSDEHRFGSDAFLLADFADSRSVTRTARSTSGPDAELLPFCCTKSASGQNVGN